MRAKSITKTRDDELIKERINEIEKYFTFLRYDETLTHLNSAGEIVISGDLEITNTAITEIPKALKIDGIHGVLNLRNSSITNLESVPRFAVRILLGGFNSKFESLTRSKSLHVGTIDIEYAPFLTSLENNGNIFLTTINLSKCQGLKTLQGLEKLGTSFDEQEKITVKIENCRLLDDNLMRYPGNIHFNLGGLVPNFKMVPDIFALQGLPGYPEIDHNTMMMLLTIYHGLAKYSKKGASAIFPITKALIDKGVIKGES